jgi:hypothetical protein
MHRLRVTSKELYFVTPTEERVAKIDILSGTWNEEWYLSDGKKVKSLRIA